MNMMKPAEKYQDDGPPTSFLCSYRFRLAILGFLVFLHNNMQRVSMSVAILCMVNHTAVRMLKDDQSITFNVTTTDATDLTNTTVSYLLRDIETNVTDTERTCKNSNGAADGKELLEDGPFVWDKNIQGHILGSYFYGYLVSQFPAGLLAEKFGPKWPLMIFYSVATLATLFTPLAAKFSPIMLMVFRILIGIGSGALFPCMHVMWSRWAPPMERSKLAGITYAGCMAAAMVGLPLSGVLCKYGFSQGWDSIFYIIGASSAVIILLWVVLSSDTPAKNPRVSSREKQYILTSLKGQGSENIGKTSLPWRSVLKSGPVWAIIASNFCSDWGLYTLLTNIPTFLSEVLQFKIESNGLFSALPFLGLWINMNVSPIIADKLRESRVASTTKTRKIFNTIGMLVPAVFLAGLGFVECTSPYIGIALLVIAITFSGCAYTGFLVNHMDIAPKFAGTLLGISNGLGAMSGFIAPNVAAALTPNQTRLEWQIVFFISSGVYTFGAIIYLIFGSGSIQSWALDKPEPEEIGLKIDNPKGDVEHTNGGVTRMNGDVDGKTTTCTSSENIINEKGDDNSLHSDADNMSINGRLCLLDEKGSRQNGLNHVA